MLLLRRPSVEKLFDIIYEDNELLVINKPAGLVCHPTKTDEYSSLISRARLHLGPGSHPQLVNRLDRETSGITLVAKDADTAHELRRIWENRQVEKDYLAIVHGHGRTAHGGIEAPLARTSKAGWRLRIACERMELRRGRSTGFSTSSPATSCLSPSCSCGRRRGANTRYGFTWRTSGIRLWATSCMAVTRICIWPWSKTD